MLDRMHEVLAAGQKDDCEATLRLAIEGGFHLFLVACLGLGLGLLEVCHEEVCLYEVVALS